MSSFIYYSQFIGILSSIVVSLSCYAASPFSQQWVQEHLPPASVRESLDNLFKRADITAHDMDTMEVLLKKFEDSPDEFNFFKVPKRLGPLYSYVRYIVFETDTVPDYVIKLQAVKELLTSQNNLSRIVEADRINDVANKLKAKVRAPKKYAYPLPGANRKMLDRNFAVLAEKIKPDLTKRLESMTDEQFHDLCEVIRQTYFADVRSENIVFDSNGFAVIWDTEPISRLFMAKPNYDFYSLGIPPLYELIIAYKLMDATDAQARRKARILARTIFTIYRGIMALQSLANTPAKKNAYNNCIAALTKKALEEAEQIQKLYSIDYDKILSQYQTLPVLKIPDLLKHFPQLPSFEEYRQFAKK